MRTLFRKLTYLACVLTLSITAVAQVKTNDTGRNGEHKDIFNQPKTKEDYPDGLELKIKDDIKSGIYENNTAKKNDNSVLVHFPKNTVWLNTDFPVAENTFQEKLVLLVYSDFNCVECAYALSKLEDELMKFPQVQLVEIIKGNEANPIRRNFVLQYVQQYAFSHPIAIVSEYPEDQKKNISEIPTFVLYPKDINPGYSSSGITGLSDIVGQLKTYTSDTKLMKSCNLFQSITTVPPHSWADPVLENPTYLTANESDGTIFVNDAAHNRIVELDKAGYCVRSIGSSYYGYSDDVIANSKFDHPHGVCYFNGSLYIADTYNHRIREADLDDDRVRSVLGNGTDPLHAGELLKGVLDPIGLPIDIVEWNGKLFVASASSNAIYEFDPKSGEAKKFAEIKGSKSDMKRTTIQNLSVGKTYLYVVLNDGSYVQIDKKASQLGFAAKTSMEISALAEWNGELVGSSANANQILLFQKGTGWKSIAGTGALGALNGAADAASFNMPCDLTLLNGELIISDRENHGIRKLSASKEGKVRSYPIAATTDIVIDMAAHTEGEMVVMDTVFIGNRESTITVNLELGGYNMVESGRNEIDINDIPGSYIRDYEIKDGKFSFQVNNAFTGYDVYVEVYLFLEHPDRPGVYVVKRAYLAFVVSNKPDAPVQQEQLYRVNLLPQ